MPAAYSPSHRARGRASEVSVAAKSPVGCHAIGIGLPQPITAGSFVERKPGESSMTSPTLTQNKRARATLAVAWCAALWPAVHAMAGPAPPPDCPEAQQDAAWLTTPACAAQLLLTSVASWNSLRAAQPSAVPALAGADLSRAALSGADLHRANLKGARLASADLQQANLAGADLAGVDLSGALLSEADLSGTDVT
ncbi:MAG: pentapeptide repeat-containing protein, partial [Myxococcales bacterium]|nr:pentapeptide repeat-containing protein [Myxococcales bacterium]